MFKSQNVETSRNIARLDDGVLLIIVDWLLPAV